MTQSLKSNRLLQCWQSFRSLPLWVQIWVAGILVPVNAAAFLMLDDTGAVWVAWAAIGVLATNVPIMLWERGMSKLMSAPHLVIWGPLQIALVLRLTGTLGAEEPGGRECLYLFIVLVVNAISLVFDALDTWRWVQGDRTIPGAT
jgi:hypothetical protein